MIIVVWGFCALSCFNIAVLLFCLYKLSREIMRVVVILMRVAAILMRGTVCLMRGTSV